jgi:hypothetical protein
MIIRRSDACQPKKLFLVRGFGGCAATHAKGTGPARAFLALLVSRPWVVVTVPTGVPWARW